MKNGRPIQKSNRCMGGNTYLRRKSQQPNSNGNGRSQKMDVTERRRRAWNEQQKRERSTKFQQPKRCLAVAGCGWIVGANVATCTRHMWQVAMAYVADCWKRGVEWRSAHLIFSGGPIKKPNRGTCGKLLASWVCAVLLSIFSQAYKVYGFY